MVKLTATTAVHARQEALSKFPQGGTLTGFFENEAVYMTTVRAKGDQSHVATAHRNRSPRANRFEFEPTEVKRG